MNEKEKLNKLKCEGLLCKGSCIKLCKDPHILITARRIRKETIIEMKQKYKKKYKKKYESKLLKFKEKSCD